LDDVIKSEFVMAKRRSKRELFNSDVVAEELGILKPPPDAPVGSIVCPSCYTTVRPDIDECPGCERRIRSRLWEPSQEKDSRSSKDSRPLSWSLSLTRPSNRLRELRRYLLSTHNGFP